MKKVISLVLVLSMIMSLFCTFAIASSAAEKKALEGEKNAEHIEDDKYGITVKVPGGDGEIQHDEVILMVDGSYSMDNEWPAMKNAINLIGETVLNGNGNTQLTLMAFGMGDNIVLEHVKDAAALAASLGALPGNLLYGRSSTNCEAGFTGVAEYIANHDSSLRDAYVIFISDGNLNTDETPRAFDANWQTWTAFGALAVAQETFGGTVGNGKNFPAAFTKIFGNRFDGATREAIIERALGGEVTDEEFLKFAEQVWTDVYAYSGLTRGVQYPISDAERAFVKYDKENGTYIQDLFYYSTFRSKYVTYGDRWTRTPVAADALAAMAQVKAMYVVDYDGYTSWMDTGIKSEKSEFIHSEGIAGLCAALSGVVETLSRTPFNDVVVVDYMSKWVNLVPETIKVTDAEGKVVAAFDAENSQKNASGNYTSYAFKWIGEPLCKNKAPIVLDLIPESEYVAGGAEVIGNMSGDIYRITWNLKDGPLYRHDAYELHYDVTVDYDEKGFKYDVNLPANGNTDIKYFDEDGKENEVEIKVPDIIVRRLVSEEGKIVGMKRLNGSNPGYYRFNFLLTDTATGKTVVATNDSTGRFSFDVGSKEPGIYFYTLEEINDGDPDVIYDDDKYNVTVIIDETGTYVYCTEDIVFNNRTVKPAKATIKGTKYLDGKPADGFTFILKDKYGNTVDVAESENGKFSFTLSMDAGGTYTYYVSEMQGDDDNIVYDDSVFEVKVTVTKAKNNYKATVSLIGATKIAFYNNTIPEETTEVPEETTVAPEETTEAPEETTEVPEETTAPEETTEVPEETTAPEETTVAPEETTVAPEETTEAPEETTVAPEETTEVPEETTEAPEETTEVPEETTAAPEETTEAPEETTEAPEVTTEPEEEITEEPTPLDPAPETTEPEEEITDPEIPLDPNPDTGDSSIVIAIIAVASIALAALYIKRREVIEE